MFYNQKCKRYLVISSYILSLDVVKKNNLSRTESKLAERIVFDVKYIRRDLFRVIIKNDYRQLAVIMETCFNNFLYECIV